MPLVEDLIGVKLPWAQAEALGGNVVTLAGVGTAQSGAAIIKPPNTFVRGTTAGGQTAFVFDTATQLGTPYWFTNTSSTTALVYPPSGGAINGGSADASVSVPQNVTVVFIRESATAWIAQVSAGGAGSFASLAVAGNATVGGTLGVTGATTLAAVTATTITGTSITTSATNFLHITSAALADGAAAQTATLLNAPAAGNPTKWVAINDNGTTRYLPLW